MATTPEFPGLSGLGPTYEDALRELLDVLPHVIQVLLDEGLPLPSPRTLLEPDA